MTGLREQCIEVFSGCAYRAQFMNVTCSEHGTNHCDDCSHDFANEYLGRLLEANGCRTVDEIVRAADDADEIRRGEAGYLHPLDPVPFFAAILDEAFAKGRGETFAQSWFERHGIAEFSFGMDAHRCRYRDGVEKAETYANGRWSEWGERAMVVQSLLDVALYGPSLFRIPPFTMNEEAANVTEARQRRSVPESSDS